MSYTETTQQPFRNSGSINHTYLFKFHSLSQLAPGHGENDHMIFEVKMHASLHTHLTIYLPTFYNCPHSTGAGMCSVTFPLEERRTPSHGMTFVTLPALFCHIRFPSSLTSRISIARSKNKLWLMYEERKRLWRTRGNQRIKVCSAVLGTGINEGYWE